MYVPNDAWAHPSIRGITGEITYVDGGFSRVVGGITE